MKIEIPKKSHLPRLRKIAIKLWFEKCLKSKCEVCGQPANQVHHYYYKSSYGHLMFDLDNGISICQKCHAVLHWRDPKRIEEQIIAKRGISWYNRLKKRSQQKPVGSYQTKKYYKDIIEKLK